MFGKRCDCCIPGVCPEDLEAFFGCVDPDNPNSFLWDFHVACPAIGEEVTNAWAIALLYDEDENQLVPIHPNGVPTANHVVWECGCSYYAREIGFKDDAPLLMRLVMPSGNLLVYHKGAVVATYVMQDPEWSVLCPQFMDRQSFDAGAFAASPPIEICIRPLSTAQQSLCHRMCNGVFGTGYEINTADLTATTSVDCWAFHLNEESVVDGCEVHIGSGSPCLDNFIEVQQDNVGPCGSGVMALFGNLSCNPTFTCLSGCAIIPTPSRIAFEEINGVPKLVWYGPQSGASVNQHYSILRKFSGDNFFRPGMLWADPTGCTGDLVFTTIESQLVPAALLADIEGARATMADCVPEPPCDDNDEKVTCGSLCHTGLPNSITFNQNGPTTELADCTDCTSGSCRWVWKESFGESEFRWEFQSSSCQGECMCGGPPEEDGEFEFQVQNVACLSLAS